MANLVEAQSPHTACTGFHCHFNELTSNMRNSTSILLAAAFLWCLTANTAIASTSYTAKLIGENSPGSYFNAVAINDLGYATGQRYNSAYIWNPSTGAFQTLALEGVAYGLDINNSFQVVGFVGLSNAVRWSNGVAEVIGDWRSVAYKINNSGTSVGWQYAPNPYGTGPQNATVWNGPVSNMLSQTGRLFAAEAINDAGLVVGATSSHQLFTWNGQLQIYDDFFVGDLDLNNAGTIVGTLLNGYDDSFILNGGTQPSIVRGLIRPHVNALGVVVGHGILPGLQGAVVLDDNLQKVLLRTLIADGQLTDSVIFSRPLDINNTGQILVEGADTANGGNTQYYLLTPVSGVPELNSKDSLLLGLAICYIGAILLRRRRQSCVLFIRR